MLTVPPLARCVSPPEAQPDPVEFEQVGVASEKLVQTYVPAGLSGATVIADVSGAFCAFTMKFGELPDGATSAPPAVTVVTTVGVPSDPPLS
jgi:hypothetical protein